MARYLRNTVVLAKLESTYGTDASPSASDALLVSDVTINPLNANNVKRDLVRGYFGGSPELVGTASVEVSFTVEMAGSGTPTTAPAWGKLLQACGMASTVQAASVDYTPVSVFGASSSLTIHYYLDGAKYILLGARGSFTVSMEVGDRPMLKFRFVGLNGGLSAVANPSPTLTAWKTPVVVTNANTTAIVFGSAVAYASSTGVVSGGTARTGRGLTLDVGNNVVFQPLVGEEVVAITGRDSTGSVSVDLSATVSSNFMDDIVGNVLTGMGFTHGTATGNTIVIYAPGVQRTDPTIEDFNGQVMQRYNLRLTPVSGNDELRIVSR